MSKAQMIRQADERSWNAWAAQRAAYGLPLDDDTFVAWWERLEAQARMVRA
jgi:hypothetical protein